MPSVTKKSDFSLVGSLRSHAADPIDLGQDFTRPPPCSGVAKLISMSFGQYKKPIEGKGIKVGDRFFRAAGTILEPESATYVPQVWDPEAIDPKTKKKGAVVNAKKAVTERAAGRQTSIMIPLCDTLENDGKGGKELISADEHSSKMGQIIRSLGGTNYLDDIETEEDVVAKMEALVAEHIPFRFVARLGRPSADYPTPMTFENWLGTEGLENFQTNGEPAAGTVDESGLQAGEGPAPGEEEAAPEPEAEAGDVSSEDDLDELATAADGTAGPEQKAAAKRLEQLAVEAGIEKDAENNLPGDNWTELAELIKSTRAEAEEGGAEGAAEETPDEPAWEPAAGGQCKYQVLDTKGKPVLDKNKKPRKPAICTIKSISAKNKTATLTDATTKSTYQGVKLDLLLPPE